MIRIQLSRKKGWRMPEGAVKVDRSTPYGNPFPWKGDWITWAAVALGYRADEAGRRAASVALYRAWMTGTAVVAKRSASDSGGTVEYTDGRTATLGQIVQGFAAIATNVVPPPTIPENPPSLEPLKGATAIACWCPIGDPTKPCHGDEAVAIGRELGLWS